MEDFLKVEYESCLGLIRYYDERHLSLVKFTTAVSSSVISLIFGFRAFSPSTQSYFWSFAAALTGVAALGLLTIFFAMVQNRLYFVYPARQVNAIRRMMLAKVTAEFIDNQMYTSTDVRAFKFFSLQSLMNFLVAMQIGVFIAFCWFAASADSSEFRSFIWPALLMSGSVSIGLFALSAWYLITRGRQHADASIHRTKDNAA